MSGSERGRWKSAARVTRWRPTLPHVRFGGGRLETQVTLCAGRLSYILLGLIGPVTEAEEIKERITTFLRTALKLTLAAEKTLMTPAHTGKARFLGYDIGIMNRSDKFDNQRRRVVNGKVHIPPDLVVEAISAHRKPPDVRICKLSIQSGVGTRPPSTSTPQCPACRARR